MSIASKHAYRFGYLKSDQWINVRLEALVREKAKCQICGEESISNDAHHIWYPDNIYETTQEHLVILCRACHDFAHSMLPECKTKDQEKGKCEWIKFRNAVLAWRADKVILFKSQDGLSLADPQDIKRELLVLKQYLCSKANTGKPISKKELGKLLSGLKALSMQ